MSLRTPQLLAVTGTSGVGKTTALMNVQKMFADRGVKLLKIDYFDMCEMFDFFRHRYGRVFHEIVYVQCIFSIVIKELLGENRPKLILLDRNPIDSALYYHIHGNKEVGGENFGAFKEDLDRYKDHRDLLKGVIPTLTFVPKTSKMALDLMIQRQNKIDVFEDKYVSDQSECFKLWTSFNDTPLFEIDDVRQTTDILAKYVSDLLDKIEEEKSPSAVSRTN